MVWPAGWALGAARPASSSARGGWRCRRPWERRDQQTRGAAAAAASQRGETPAWRAEEEGACASLRVRGRERTPLALVCAVCTFLCETTHAAVATEKAQRRKKLLSGSAPPWPGRPCVVPPVRCRGPRRDATPARLVPLDGAGEYLELASSPSAGLDRSIFINLAASSLPGTIWVEVRAYLVLLTGLVARFPRLPVKRGRLEFIVPTPPSQAGGHLRRPAPSYGAGKDLLFCFV